MDSNNHTSMHNIDLNEIINIINQYNNNEATINMNNIDINDNQIVFNISSSFSGGLVSTSIYFCK